jgi:hypothetical protein
MRTSEVIIRYEDDVIWVRFEDKNFSLRLAPANKQVIADMSKSNIVHKEIYEPNDKIVNVSVEDITLEIRTEKGRFLLRRVFDEASVEVIRFD